MKLLAKDALRISRQIDDTMRGIEAAITVASRRGETSIPFLVPSCQVGAVAQVLNEAGYNVAVPAFLMSCPSLSVTISWKEGDE